MDKPLAFQFLPSSHMRASISCKSPFLQNFVSKVIHFQRILLIWFSFPPVSQYGFNEGSLRRTQRPHLRQQQQQRRRRQRLWQRQQQQLQQQQQLLCHEMPLTSQNLKKIKLFLTRVTTNEKNKIFNFSFLMSSLEQKM